MTNSKMIDGTEFVRTLEAGEDGAEALKADIAKRMTAYQLRNGQAIRDLVDAHTARWLAEWANRTGYGVLDHVKRRARFDTSHAAIARHQQ